MPSPSESSGSSGWLQNNVLVRSISDVCQRVQEMKKSFNLSNPGSIENLHKEARNVSCSNFLFEGGKLDLNKILSNNFQINQSYSLPPGNSATSYRFGSVFVNGNDFLHGMVDLKGELQGRGQYSLTKNFIQKIQLQISKMQGNSVVQLESEYLGSDYTLNFKAINPRPAEQTGIFNLSYLQSVTENLALGVDGVYQKPTPEIEEAGMTLLARYGRKNWIATLSLQNFVALQASYFHKVSETTELATEVQAMLAGPEIESLTTVSCKTDYHLSSVRAQLDSSGKVGAYLEHRIMPSMSLLVSGELDHIKGRSRFGVGLSFDA